VFTTLRLFVFTALDALRMFAGCRLLIGSPTPWVISDRAKPPGKYDCMLLAHSLTLRVPRHRVGLLVLAPMFLMQTAWGQDLEPRSYANTPVGMNFLLFGYFYSDGDVAIDPSLPVKDGNVTVHGEVIGYVRSLDMRGKSGKLSAILPYACADGSAKLAGQPEQRDVCGPTDPRLRLSVNLYGAPALTLEEFRNYRQDLILGATLQVTGPFGQYDSDKLLNIGTNRWSVKTELGASQAIGRVTFELAGAATFYTDNDNYFGGQKREQDPVYSIQGHLIYSFSHGIWGAVDGTWFRGGRTTTDGVRDDDLQENTRIGATLALPIDRHNSVKLFASTGVATRSGGDFDTIGAAWQFRWGGAH